MAAESDSPDEKLSNENKYPTPVNVYLDKLDKLNIEYSKISSTAELIDVSNKMENLMNKISYSLDFLEAMLDNPNEINNLLKIKNDILNIHELYKRFDENEQKMNKYSLEKQCEEYIKLKLALDDAKKIMKDRTILVRKIK